MSDAPQGDGWWVASDGRYYPPEQHPGYGAVSPAQPPSWTNPAAGQPAAAPAPVAAAQGPEGASPWYHAWWAIVLGLLLCFPIGLALLWTSKKQTGAKVGVSAATALLVVIGAASSGATPETVEKPTTTVATTNVSMTTIATTTVPPTTVPPMTVPPTTAPPPTPPPTTEPPRPSTTPAQDNARRKAADYLDYSAFSRTGLIKQLEYEGFSTGDATYGVDALNADWNEQAAKKAKDYLDYSAFSRSGLVEQLKYEGFTPEQAEYGVSTTGI